MATQSNPVFRPVSASLEGLPSDPFILFSFLNMKLRDNYMSLDELCEDLCVDKTALLARMAANGWEYSAENRKFW